MVFLIILLFLFIANSYQFVYDQQWKATYEWKAYCAGNLDYHYLPLQDCILENFALSPLINQEEFCYSINENEKVNGMFQEYESRMKDQEYLLSVFTAFHIQQPSTSLSSLLFEYNHHLYNAFFPLQKDLQVVKQNIAFQLQREGIFLLPDEFSLAVDHTFLTTETIQQYLNATQFVLKVIVTNPHSHSYPPRILDEQSHYRVDITLSSIEDLTNFLSEVKTNRYFYTTHLTFHIDACFITKNQETIVDLLVELLQESVFPYCLVLSFLYSYTNVEDEKWSQCFLSSSFPSLQNILVYRLSSDCYSMERRELEREYVNNGEVLEGENVSNEEAMDKESENSEIELKENDVNIGIVLEEECVSNEKAVKEECVSNEIIVKEEKVISSEESDLRIDANELKINTSCLSEKEEKKDSQQESYFIPVFYNSSSSSSSPLIPSSPVVSSVTPTICIEDKISPSPVLKAQDVSSEPIPSIINEMEREEEKKEEVNEKEKELEKPEDEKKQIIDNTKPSIKSYNNDIKFTSTSFATITIYDFENGSNTRTNSSNEENQGNNQETMYIIHTKNERKALFALLSRSNPSYKHMTILCNILV